jgi:hypothetical protein
MQKKHIRFKSIGQFRNLIGDVVRATQFQGFDKDGEPIINKNMPNPILKFNGTVKLHGTCGAICTNSNEIWYQSRKNILSIEKDNHGFVSFCTKRKESIEKIVREAWDRAKIIDGIVSVFGEFCGEGIQNKVAIAQLPKMFVIFAVKVSLPDDVSYYISCDNLKDEENKIYNIHDFETYSIDIDFNYPALAQEKITEMVNEVENYCPVAKQLGVKDGCLIGEGIVWTTEYKGNQFWMKTKGEKHSISKSKSKKTVSIDPEKVKSIKEFVDYAATENRMNQAIDELFISKNEEPTIKKMGDFLSWVMKDIAKEEADVLAANDLTFKDVSRSVSNKARPWFQNLLDKNAGLK